MALTREQAKAVLRNAVDADHEDTQRRLAEINRKLDEITAKEALDMVEFWKKLFADFHSVMAEGDVGPDLAGVLAGFERIAEKEARWLRETAAMLLERHAPPSASGEDAYRQLGERMIAELTDEPPKPFIPN